MRRNHDAKLLMLCEQDIHQWLLNINIHLVLMRPEPTMSIFRFVPPLGRRTTSRHLINRSFRFSRRHRPRDIACGPMSSHDFVQVHGLVIGRMPRLSRRPSRTVSLRPSGILAATQTPGSAQVGPDIPAAAETPGHHHSQHTARDPHHEGPCGRPACASRAMSGYLFQDASPMDE
jgi:hypothetical protein